jgi:hypothetical protein
MFMPKFNTKTFILRQVSFPKYVSPFVLRAVAEAATSITNRPIYFPGSKLDAHIAVFLCRITSSPWTFNSWC